MERLRFDEATHRYYRGSIEIPGCTRVLDHAGLVSYDHIRQDILEKKSRLGTVVHIATHFYDEDNLDWDSIGDNAKGRVEAWASFRAHTGFKPRLIEQRYMAEHNGMSYGLQIDREGLFLKEEAIIDIKCTSDIGPWVAIQLAGYALGVPGDASPLALFARRRRIAVQLFENGKYKKFDFTDKQDAYTFGSALHITHWKMKNGLKIKDLDI